MVHQDGKVAVTHCYDNRAVTGTSNFAATEDEDTAKPWSKTDKCYVAVKRPAVVKLYNRSMGGVDKNQTFSWLLTA